MPRKVKQYFGIGSAGDIYIEKKWKTFKGDPIKLEKEWKSTQRENAFLKDRVTALETKINFFEGVGGIKEQLENRILGLQNAHGETFKSFQDRLNSQERFINQQAKEIGKARNFEKFLRKDTDQLEEKCKCSQGKLKDWNSVQIRKWLKETKPHFKQVYLPKTYELVNEGFYSWIKLLEAIADPEPTITTTDSLKKVNELILSQNQLNRFLFLQKAANLNELDQKIKSLKNDLGQEQKKSQQLELKINNFKDQSLKDKEIHQELQKQIDLLELELKGEKQMSQSQINSYLAKINALKAILNKPKPIMVDQATQTELTMAEIVRMETRLDTAKKYILSTIFKGKRESEQTRKILYDYSILEKESWDFKKLKLSLINEGNVVREEIEKLERRILAGGLTKNDLEEALKNVIKKIELLKKIIPSDEKPFFLGEDFWNKTLFEDTIDVSKNPHLFQAFYNGWIAEGDADVLNQNYMNEESPTDFISYRAGLHVLKSQDYEIDELLRITREERVTLLAQKQFIKDNVEQLKKEVKTTFSSVLADFKDNWVFNEGHVWNPKPEIMARKRAELKKFYKALNDAVRKTTGVSGSATGISNTVLWDIWQKTSQKNKLSKLLAFYDNFSILCSNGIPSKSEYKNMIRERLGTDALKYTRGHGNFFNYGLFDEKTNRMIVPVSRKKIIIECNGSSQDLDQKELDLKSFFEGTGDMSTQYSDFPIVQINMGRFSKLESIKLPSNLLPQNKIEITEDYFLSSNPRVFSSTQENIFLSCEAYNLRKGNFMTKISAETVVDGAVRTIKIKRELFPQK